jgi:hypothetical protein
MFPQCFNEWFFNMKLFNGAKVIQRYFLPKLFQNYLEECTIEYLKFWKPFWCLEQDCNVNLKCFANKLILDVSNLNTNMDNN